MPTNSRTAGDKGFDPNFFYESLEDEEGTLQPLSFYPNPVKDVLTIQADSFEDESLQVEVYSLAGVLLYKAEHRTEPGTGELEVDLQQLRQGVYLLRLQGAQQQQTIKISKE
nr:T9SS type A sorting domain-containing protein [Cesiribacter sp. SM1]